MIEEFFTVAEAAEKLDVSPRTIQRYCKQGRLNHKWISGKRHKELRILPPISLDKLPGVKRRSHFNVADYVTRINFEEITTKLDRELMKKDIRIDELRQEIAQLKSKVDGDSGRLHGPYPAKGSRFQGIVDSLAHEYENIRPSEKRLIIKLAETIKEHNRFLRTLGYNGDEEST